MLAVGFSYGAHNVECVAGRRLNDETGLTQTSFRGAGLPETNNRGLKPG
jgi:hypothetical protein